MQQTNISIVYNTVHLLSQKIQLKSFSFQFVLLTFDDAINIINVETYRELLDNRRNINQCPATATFFLSHQYTNYQLVNELYNKGHEIALHSITHSTPQTYWAEGDVELMRREFGDQKELTAHFANIPANSMRG